MADRGTNKYDAAEVIRKYQANNGAKGGTKTLQTHGPQHFKNLATKAAAARTAKYAAKMGVVGIPPNPAGKIPDIRPPKAVTRLPGGHIL